MAMRRIREDLPNKASREIGLFSVAFGAKWTARVAKGGCWVDYATGPLLVPDRAGRLPARSPAAGSRAGEAHATACEQRLNQESVNMRRYLPSNRPVRNR